MMKFELETVDNLLAEMESILGRVKKISKEFNDALDSKRQEAERKAA